MRWPAAALCLALALAAPAGAFPVERCIALGDALDSPAREGEWGYAIEPAHLDAIAAAGFDTVRLPVRFATRWDGARIDPAFLARVDGVLRAGLDRGLAMILDVHHHDALMTAADPVRGAEADAFVALWETLADHYAGWPPDLVFEILNEPSGALDTAAAEALFARVVPVIRARHPHRWLVVSGGDWGSLDGLADLAGRYDAHTALSFHYYAPWDFTHQQADWIADAPAARGWDPAEGAAAVAADMDRAAALGRAAGRPVFLGEFGAIARAAAPGRWAWTATVRRAAEARGVAWCAWSFGSNFRHYDTAARRWLDGALPALVD